MVRISQLQIEKACEHLGQGGIIIVPTDTVYGLACKAADEGALGRIYLLKNRPTESPLQLLLAEPAGVGDYAASVPEYAWKLMEQLWPGGLTVVLKAVEGLPRQLAGPKGTVGLRVPALPSLQELISRSGGALAATSANISGQRSPWSVEEIPRRIQTGVQYVIDTGALKPVAASTVVDCTGERPRQLRAGAIGPGRLKQLGVEV